ncbi:thioesterase II family protein [Nocardia sp. NPDC003482]
MVAESSGTTWLRELRGAPAPRAILICFPPGGGSAAAYRALAQHIDPAVAVHAVQYPGRQDRLGDPLIPDLPRMADLIAADLPTWPPSARIALFGHSMGATVAFETARRLAASGRTPDHLFVSGRVAPDAPYEGALHKGPDEALIAELQRLANDPASVEILRTEPSLAELVLPAVRGDYEAVETYTYTPADPLTCPISALLGDDDPTVNADDMRRWHSHTTAPFDLTTFPGRHFYLDETPTAVAQLISTRLG